MLANGHSIGSIFMTFGIRNLCRPWVVAGLFLGSGSAVAAQTALAAQPAVASQRLATLLASLPPTPREPIAFTEQRMSPLLSRPLEFRGELLIEPDGSIDKRLEGPGGERVTIQAGSLKIEQRGGTRILNLANNRRWREFHAGLAGLLNRDAAALQQGFNFTIEETAKSWRLLLRPRTGKLKITASGEPGRITTLRIEQGQNDWQELRF